MNFRNLGKVDRAVRVIAGLAITPFAFVGPANPLFFLGLIPLVTGLVGFCPAYRIFGISTCAAGGGSCGNCAHNETKAA